MGRIRELIGSSLLGGLFLFTLLFTSGCSPGLQKSISINRLPEPRPVSFITTPFIVRPFLDERAEQAVVIIDGREVMPDGDVVSTARGALESVLSEQGASVSTGGAIIQGAIRKWELRVDPGFPLTEISGECKLYISITDRKGAPRWNGTFSGELSKKAPYFSEDSIAELLGEVLSVAMHEIVSDDKFQRAIKQVGNR